MIRIVGPVLAATPLTIACGPSSGSNTEVCGSGGDLSGPLQERTFTTQDGMGRTWLLRLPASYEEGTRTDVVFNFHGNLSAAHAQLVYGDFTEQADRDSVILVMPDAKKIYDDPQPTHELSGYWSQAWEANLREADSDVDFITGLVELMRSEYCTGDFFATGMSAGGDMVSALACLPDSPFEAFGPVTYLYYAPEECGDAPPRPLVYFHGADDAVVPMEGSGDPWFDPPVPEVVQTWAEHNGCDPERAEERVSDEVIHYFWQNCDATTEWYMVEGGGHTWPGSPSPDYLGYVTDDISASDLVWELFFGGGS